MKSLEAHTSTVATQSGRIAGRSRAGLEFYAGIPFAAAPVGARRFAAPEAIAPWTGVREAKRFGASAPQPTVRPEWLRALDRRHSLPSEDCLYLNVWTPSSRAGRRPVFVWFHGGGYHTGAGSWFVYAGDELARRGDLVVVTLNYRLGALGGLNLRSLGLDEGASPNLALRDQIAGLEWVRENIEAFGGDPNRVTVAGQSAGAMSVGSLLSSERARGLFHRAILQSGAASNVLSSDQASEVAERFLGALGRSVASPDLAKVLRSSTTSTLLHAQQAARRELKLPLGTLNWQPSIDGELVPDMPLRGLQRGDGARIPLLVGTTRDEWKMFTFNDAKRRNLDRSTLADYLRRTLPDPAQADRALEHYEHCDESRAPRRASDAWVAFQSDRVFRQPAIELADAIRETTSSPVFFYRFDFASPFFRDRLGSFHAIDVPFVFGTLRHPLLAPALGAFPSARRLSTQIQNAWIAFAHGREKDGAGLAFASGRAGEAEHVWPEYEPIGRAAFRFGEKCGPTQAVAPETHRFWREISQR